MTSLNRVLITWTGSSVVGNSVSVLHFSASDNAAPPVAAIKSAFAAAANCFPQGLQITIPNTGDVIEDTTGNLTGTWSTTGGGAILGSTARPAAAGVGACIGWNTGGIVTGKAGKPHRLRGRLFLVPLQVDMYDTDGTIAPAQMTNLVNFANALQASGPLAVWHRPTTPGGTDGNSYGVISSKIRDKVAYLSSRRD